MFKLGEYARNFEPHPTPSLLVELYEYQRKLEDFFSDGFELRVDEDKSAFESWSKHPEFLSALFPIGNATGSGSTYALWLPNAGSLEDAPVLVFGDEGGVHVVAESISALLRLLSYDTEPMIDGDGVSYFKLDDADPSEEAESYARFLERSKLEPIDDASDADALVLAAQERYGAAFTSWFRRFSKT
jgi:hypothetical protein